MKQIITQANRRPSRRRACWALALVMSATGCVTTGAWADAIRLHRHAEAGPQVLLQDIASLDGGEASAFGKLVVAEFATGQDVLTLDIRTVHRALFKAQAPLAKIALQGHRQCTIERRGETAAAPTHTVQPTADQTPATNTGNTHPKTLVANPNQTITAAGSLPLLTLRDVVIDTVAQGLQALPNQVRVRADGLGGSVLDQAVSDPRSYRVLWPGHKAPGQTLLTIQRLHANQIVESLPVTVWIEQRVDAVCPAPGRFLSENQRVSARDLSTQTIWINFDPRQLITSPREAVGQKLLAAVAPDQPLRLDHLPKPVLIRRGDIVDVRTAVGNILVTVRGKANHDGRLGQRIAFTSVSNPRSRKVFTAEVVSRGVAMVQTVTKTTLASAATQTVLGAR